MTSNVGIDAEGTVTQYKLEKFQFKLDKSQQAAVFGNSGYFKGYKTKLTDAGDGEWERWMSQTQFAITKFNEGKFFSASTYWEGMSAVSANCDKF